MKQQLKYSFREVFKNYAKDLEAYRAWGKPFNYGVIILMLLFSYLLYTVGKVENHDYQHSFYCGYFYIISLCIPCVVLDGRSQGQEFSVYQFFIKRPITFWYIGTVLLGIALLMLIYQLNVGSVPIVKLVELIYEWGGGIVLYLLLWLYFKPKHSLTNSLGVMFVIGVILQSIVNEVADFLYHCFFDNPYAVYLGLSSILDLVIYPFIGLVVLIVMLRYGTPIVTRILYATMTYNNKV